MMKKIFIITLLFPFTAMAGIKFPSDRLRVMDIETLQRIIAKNLSMAQKISNNRTEDTGQNSQGTELIKESLQLIFACPDQNNTTSQIYSSIEGLAFEYGGIQKFLIQIIDEGIRSLSKSGSDKALLREQNTYLYILNNIMLEIRPKIEDEKNVSYREIVEKIRNADIEVSNDLKSYRVLNSLSHVVNPSKFAENILGKKKCSWWQIFGC